MAQTKAEIQALLAGVETGPRHRFGQNFMIDGNLVRTIAAAGGIVAGDVVVEVGPGTGTLTDELLATPAARVVAVEIDRDLARLLRDRYAGVDRFTLVEGDALAGKHAVNADLSAVLFSGGPEGRAGPADNARPSGPPLNKTGVKLVANLPYNIASPLVIELLIAGVDLLAFTVQKEVADRLRATGGENYGPLSVMAQMLSRVEVLRTLPPQAFWPPPKIDSALVRMTRDDRLGGRAGAFGRFVQGVFAGRRKTLRKAMAVAGLTPPQVAAAVSAAGVDDGCRPEQVPPDAWLQMFDAAAG